MQCLHCPLCSVVWLVLSESVQCVVYSRRLVLLESGPVGKPERLISPAAALQVEPFIIVIIIILIIITIITIIIVIIVIVIIIIIISIIIIIIIIITVIIVVIIIIMIQ